MVGARRYPRQLLVAVKSLLTQGLVRPTDFRGTLAVEARFVQDAYAFVVLPTIQTSLTFPFLQCPPTSDCSPLSDCQACSYAVSRCDFLCVLLIYISGSHSIPQGCTWCAPSGVIGIPGTCESSASFCSYSDSYHFSNTTSKVKNSKL